WWWVAVLPPVATPPASPVSCRSEISGQPAAQLVDHAAHAAANRPAGTRATSARTMQQQTHAGRDQALVAGAAQLVLHHLEDFLVARLHALRQRLPREPAWWAVADAGYLDGFLGMRQPGLRAGVLDLDFLGVRGRRVHAVGNVAGDLIAADR